MSLPSLALLSLDTLSTGVDKRGREEEEAEEESQAKLRKTCRGEFRGSREDTKFNCLYDIYGPVPEGVARDKWIAQIVDHVDRLCKGDIGETYARVNLGYTETVDKRWVPRPGLERVPMGERFKPFLWVLVDQESTEIVYAFCYATLRPHDDEGVTIYEVQLVCSERMFGMALFEEAMKYAKQVMNTDTSGNDFVVEVYAISEGLEESYNKRARAIFGMEMEVSLETGSLHPPDEETADDTERYMRLVLRGDKPAFPEPAEMSTEPEVPSPEIPSPDI